MTQNFQNVTLSFTLPISCQICLGKVRKPTICSNNHVFCFGCIDVWLKKSSQCPTCRVPITPENPCREIIGATNDSESNECYSVKKRLRKTRGELLLREYEDEIETLLKENEELKSKNSSLEVQLNTALEPSTIVPSQSGTPVDHSFLEDSANKLRAANDLCKKLKQDMDKLKEANKTLRSQNVDLIQGNVRLKAEVESRSPQKFGRYTVAAQEAKILQYERQMTQLKKALERSDRYIEELEAQVAERRGEGAPRAGEAQLEGSISGEWQVEGPGSAQRSRIATMRRSLSEMDEPSVCTDLDTTSPRMGLLHGCGFLLTTSGVRCGRGRLFGAMSPGEEVGPSSPSTPSSSLKCLNLRSPVGCSEGRPASPRLPYLRRLFEDCRTTRAQGSTDTQPSLGSVQPAKHVVCGGWREAEDTDSPSSVVSDPALGLGGSGGRATGHSEDHMDAAYLDKVSELDSMMAEGEDSTSQSSQHMPSFSVPLPPPLEAGTDLTHPHPEAQEQATPPVNALIEARSHAPYRAPESSCMVPVKEAGRSSEAKKRKCAGSLATCSPSKLSTMEKQTK